MIYLAFILGFCSGGVVSALFFVRTQAKLNATLDEREMEIKRLRRIQAVSPVSFIDPPFRGIPRI